MRALQKEKEGVEVLVAAMLFCASEQRAFSDAVPALRQLVAADPNLLQRVKRANGAKYLAEDLTTKVEENGEPNGSACEVSVTPPHQDTGDDRCPP